MDNIESALRLCTKDDWKTEQSLVKLWLNTAKQRPLCSGKELVVLGGLTAGYMKAGLSVKTQ